MTFCSPVLEQHVPKRPMQAAPQLGDPDPPQALSVVFCSALTSRALILLQATSQLGNPDLTYLRRVLVDAFGSGALPRDSPMFPVIARLLK